MAFPVRCAAVGSKDDWSSAAVSVQLYSVLFTFRSLQKYKRVKTVWHKETDQKTRMLLLIA